MRARVTCSGPACRSCPGPPAVRSGAQFPLEDNLVLTQYDDRRTPAAVLRNEAPSTHAPRRPSRSTTSGRHRHGERRHAVGRQPAEGGRRPRVQRKLKLRPRPADARPRRRQHRVHPQAGDRQARRGAAVLLVSAELDEVLELSDRVAVMYRGEIVALVDGPTAEREEIGLLMATAAATRRASGGERPRWPPPAAGLERRRVSPAGRRRSIGRR